MRCFNSWSDRDTREQEMDGGARGEINGVKRDRERQIEGGEDKW